MAVGERSGGSTASSDTTKSPAHAGKDSNAAAVQRQKRQEVARQEIADQLDNSIYYLGDSSLAHYSALQELRSC